MEWSFVIVRYERGAMNISIGRHCIVCDTFFKPERRDNIYCSKSCKQKAWRDRRGVSIQEEKVTVFKMERRK
jgi:predicted nucleic acid-binding Zn ribbon protein